jgi:hypothetical protein
VASQPSRNNEIELVGIFDPQMLTLRREPPALARRFPAAHTEICISHEKPAHALRSLREGGYPLCQVLSLHGTLAIATCRACVSIHRREINMNIKRRDLMYSAMAVGLAMPAASSAHDGHQHGPMHGPLSNATVSFGAWVAGGDVPLDRFATPNEPAAENAHQLLPYKVTIKKGGSVNFIVAGFHVIAIYAPGTKPDDVNAADTTTLPGAPANLPPIINDPNNRVYRGLNPFGAPQDRVEVVQFRETGTYLVICAVLPHFQDKMWGYVRVIS